MRVVISLIVCFSFISYAQEIPAMVANEFTLSPIAIELGGGTIALENWSGSANRAPAASFKYTANFVDCSDTATTLCNQAAWADFGVALSGITAKQNLCASCISASLTHCNATLSEITKTMMIAFGRVVVSWCYDGGVRLRALDSYTTCLSVAMFDALTIRNCLTQINDPRAVGSAVSSNDLGDHQQAVFTLPKLLNNVIDTYQSSAIACMHSAIADACGEEAAALALGPAMDEIMAPMAAAVSATASPRASAMKNASSAESDDIYSKSRRFMERDYVNSAQTPQTNFVLCSIFLILALISQHSNTAMCYGIAHSL